MNDHVNDDDAGDQVDETEDESYDGVYLTYDQEMNAVDDYNDFDDFDDCDDCDDFSMRLF